MKKWIALLLAAVLCLSLAACGSKKGESAVENIEINGKKVSITDFLIERLKEYTSTEEFADREKRFADTFGAPDKPFTVTRAIELKADGLGKSNLSIHYLLVKADWQYATDDDFSDNNILIVVNYDTGEVLDQFMAEESWLEDSESTDYWNYIMLNGSLVGMTAVQLSRIPKHARNFPRARLRRSTKQFKNSIGAGCKSRSFSCLFH